MESEGKLQDLGFVGFVHYLLKEGRDLILTKPKYLIPWRAIWKPNSEYTLQICPRCFLWSSWGMEPK